jgi:hypothetical protein
MEVMEKIAKKIKKGDNADHHLCKNNFKDKIQTSHLAAILGLNLQKSFFSNKNNTKVKLPQTISCAGT